MIFHRQELDIGRGGSISLFELDAQMVCPSAAPTKTAMSWLGKSSARPVLFFGREIICKYGIYYNVGKTTVNHPFGNGLEWFIHVYTTYKNGDDWGMVDYCFSHITWYTWEIFYCHV